MSKPNDLDVIGYDDFNKYCDEVMNQLNGAGGGVVATQFAYGTEGEWLYHESGDEEGLEQLRYLGGTSAGGMAYYLVVHGPYNNDSDANDAIINTYYPVFNQKFSGFFSVQPPNGMHWTLLFGVAVGEPPFTALYNQYPAR